MSARARVAGPVIVVNTKFRVDPTRSTQLRADFMAEQRRRFKRLRQAIFTVVDNNDAFGLKNPRRSGALGRPIAWSSPPAATLDPPTAAALAEIAGLLGNSGESSPVNGSGSGPRANNLANLPRRFDFPTDAGKADAFMRWLEQAAADEILEVTEWRQGRPSKHKGWQDKYIRAAYGKGIAQSSSFLERVGIQGATGQPLSMVFAQPRHADQLATLYMRAFDQLRGVTDAMGKEISRVLTEQLVAGANPLNIAKALADRVDKIGITRAEMIARTELSRSHATATLERYSQFGVDEVNGFVEFSTSNTGVCKICQRLEGNTFKIRDAMGIIPVHPNCRCTWLPVLRSGKDVRTVTIAGDPALTKTEQKAKQEAATAGAIRAREAREGVMRGKRQIEELRKEAERIDQELAEIVSRRLDIERQAINAEFGSKEKDLLWDRVDRIDAEELRPRYDRKAQIAIEQKRIAAEIKERHIYVPKDRRGTNADYKTTRYYAGASDSDKKAWTEGNEELRKLIDKDIIPAGYEFKIKKYKRKPGSGREASYALENEGFYFNGPGFAGDDKLYLGVQANKGWVVMRSDAPRRVVVHEMGHNVEFSNPAITYAANAFVRRRTIGEKPRKLSDIYPGSGYGDDEIAFEDDFISAYIGKLYGGINSPYKPTEVISMGLEQMSANPILLAEQDPDYFEFVWRIAHNELEGLPELEGYDPDKINRVSVDFLPRGP